MRCFASLSMTGWSHPDVAPSGSEGSLGTSERQKEKRASERQKEKRASERQKEKRAWEDKKKVEVLTKQPLPILLKSKIRFILIL
jgi:hypothetical protein